MATAPLKRKSAMDSLLEAFAETIDAGAQGKTHDQLRTSEKQFNDAVDRAVAAHKQRRETAK